MALTLGSYVEIRINGSGSKWEYLAPVGFLVIFVGLLIMQVEIMVSGAIVMALGVGLGNYIRWNNR